MIQSTLDAGVCVLRLCSPPVNALTPLLLERLRSALSQAAGTPQVKAVVIAGDEQHFSAGADVELFEQIHDAQDAVQLSRVFQEAFQAIEDCPVPVIAALAGKVVGGALELAMACHGRIASEAATFAMPEVRLGINPGAGGTQRLPRLVGLPKALSMLLSGETVRASEALEAGLVDAVVPSPELFAQAVDRARRFGPPRPTTRRHDKIADGPALQAAWDEAETTVGRIRPEIIAPREILAAVRAGLTDSIDSGFRAEQEGFARCMATPAAQNKIYLFSATRQMAKFPELAGIPARTIRQAAVIGMGTMGSGIAQALIAGGLPVKVFDENPAALERGLGRIRQSLAKRVGQGKLSAAQAEQTLALLGSCTSLHELAGADLVIEAVFEDPEVKRAVLSAVEDACSAEAIVASNTSTISLDVLAQGMRCPDRLIGLHFFNPAHHMPLVEVIRRDQTPPEVLATAMAVLKRMRKTPVLVRNREGFLVNRVFVPYLKEAFWLLEEGVLPEAIDAAMVEFGFPMGPLALADMAGLDILADVDRVLSRAFAWHGPLAPIVAKLVEAGQLGQKTGAGVYRYEPGSPTPHPNPLAQSMLARVQQEGSQGSEPSGLEPIIRRLVLRMVAEAFRLLGESVARDEADIDAATVLGIGFPDFRGGVMRYARSLGLARVRAELEQLSGQYGPRFAPSDALRTMA